MSVIFWRECRFPGCCIFFFCFISKQTANQIVEVMVSNLPSDKEPTRIKNRLKKLSDNCGGRVGTISGESALIRFPTFEFAVRWVTNPKFLFFMCLCSWWRLIVLYVSGHVDVGVGVFVTFWWTWWWERSDFIFSCGDFFFITIIWESHTIAQF